MYSHWDLIIILIMLIVAFILGERSAKLSYDKHELMVSKPPYTTEDAMNEHMAKRIQRFIIQEELQDSLLDDNLRTHRVTFYIKKKWK